MIIRDLGDNSLSATLEPVALAVHLQDVDVVRETVQQRSGQAVRFEDLGPLVEGKVGGHQDGAPLASLAEDLENVRRSYEAPYSVKVCFCGIFGCGRPVQGPMTRPAATLVLLASDTPPSDSA